jgi:2-C-methyl-D-erythritol 2,4-cyclodiphosphate synthase
MNSFRVGYGEDIHAFVEGRPLILCGVNIPYRQGLLGHSDADAPLHALSDALLGALALGDIGKYFPPTDPKCEGIASSLIVKKCLSLVTSKGYTVNNVDITISSEEPKLSPYISKMAESVAQLLSIPVADVSIKAMTNEGFDAVGEKKALRAVALVSLRGD